MTLPGAPRPATGSLDQRDFTADPPAYLDPYWVRTMQRRLRSFAVTGEIGDWYPAKTPGRFAPGEQ